MGIAMVLGATVVSAQLTSDIVPRERQVPREEEVRRDLEDSRYQLGPLRLQPQVIFRNIGYNNNVFGTPEDPVADWTATVAAGTKFTLPFGPKMYFKGAALPEYTWYAELSDRRGAGGTYNASLLGLFNRMSIEVAAGTQKTLGVVSSEIDANAMQRVDDVSVDFELDVLRRLSIFANARSEAHTFEAESVASGDLNRLGDLDRDEQAARAGVRYRFRSYLDFTLGAERTESDFELRPLERNNRSEAVIFGLHYDQPRFYADLNVASREWKPVDGSTLPSYDATTGSWFLSYSLVAPIDVETFGHRRLVYSLFADNPYYLENRTGAALAFRVGQRLVFRASAETGDNDYPQVTQFGAQRIDDVRTYGGGVAIRIYRSTAVTIGITQSDLDSNLDSFDRRVIRVQSGITFGGFAR